MVLIFTFFFDDTCFSYNVQSYVKYNHASFFTVQARFSFDFFLKIFKSFCISNVAENTFLDQGDKKPSVSDQFK
jgi:hypothetical protein